MSLCAQSAVLCLFPSVDGPAAGVLPTYSIHVNEREDQQVAGQAAEADRDWELFQLIGAQDRVAFASSDCAPDQAGWFEGAVRSGEAAADWVVGTFHTGRKQ